MGIPDLDCKFMSKGFPVWWFGEECKSSVKVVGLQTSLASSNTAQNADFSNAQTVSITVNIRCAR